MSINTTGQDALIKDLESEKSDYKSRTIPFGKAWVKIFYVKELIDLQSLRNFIIKPLMQYDPGRHDIGAKLVMDNIIYTEECKIESDLTAVEDHLLKGMLVMLFARGGNYLVVNIKKVEHRPVAAPELQYALNAPRDCFIENLDVNLSLLRYRIKDKSICFKTIEIGKRSKTRVVVAYIENIANPDIIEKIISRISNIDTDSILSSGEIHSFIKNHKSILFPHAGIVERSDLGAEVLMEGRALIFVDGSNLALQAPKTMPEFLYACDDRYENKYFGMFMRLIRFAALILSYCLSSIYIGILMYHHDVLPPDYVLALAHMRAGVPFSALVGALILEFVVELIRESLLRVPVQIGTAVGIVGAIIIGQAAISANLFTPVLLIIISVELLASFAIPDYTLSNTFKLLKLFMIGMTGILGFYGFTLGQIFIITMLVSSDSFGIPYMAPLAPGKAYDLKRMLIFNRSSSSRRQEYIMPKDVIRSNRKE